MQMPARAEDHGSSHQASCTKGEVIQSCREISLWGKFFTLIYFEHLTVPKYRIQSGYIGCNRRNGDKLSSSQACCLAQLWLDAA